MGRAVPGTRVTVMGILTIYRVAAIREVGAANIRHTYLQVPPLSSFCSFYPDAVLPNVIGAPISLCHLIPFSLVIPLTKCF